MKKTILLLLLPFLSFWGFSQIPGNALEFDDYDDYVEASHQSYLNTGNELTVEGWVMPNDANNFDLVYKYSSGSSGSARGSGGTGATGSGTAGSGTSVGSGWGTGDGVGRTSRLSPFRCTVGTGSCLDIS